MTAKAESVTAAVVNFLNNSPEAKRSSDGRGPGPWMRVRIRAGQFFELIEFIR